MPVSRKAKKRANIFQSKSAFSKYLLSCPEPSLLQSASVSEDCRNEFDCLNKKKLVYKILREKNSEYGEKPSAQIEIHANVLIRAKR